jgi:2-oxoglutarate dehydrogenase complex dehydrogenase (E1) component-like enzyme
MNQLTTGNCHDESALCSLAATRRLSKSCTKTISTIRFRVREWRDYFDKLAQMPGYVARDVPHAAGYQCLCRTGKEGGFRAAAVAPVDDKKQVGILQMITAYRFMGDRWANLDPLKRTAPSENAELEPASTVSPMPT